MNAPVVFTIAKDLTEMQIDTNVAEADVGMIEEGQDVDFTVYAFPYRTFHGKVKQVRNAATTVQNVVTYDVVVAVKNDDLKLKPGMTTNISVIVAHRENVVQLSNAALRYRPPELQATPAPSRSGSPPRATLTKKGASPPPAPDASSHRGSRSERTIYVLDSGASKPRAVQVKVGITDSITTEVLDGLSEGEVTVIGQTGGAGNNPGQQNTNPLGGGMRFR
jgi:HlyD family secretion protein